MSISIYKQKAVFRFPPHIKKAAKFTTLNFKISFVKSLEKYKISLSMLQSHGNFAW